MALNPIGFPAVLWTTTLVAISGYPGPGAEKCQFVVYTGFFYRAIPEINMHAWFRFWKSGIVQVEVGFEDSTSWAAKMPPL